MACNDPCHLNMRKNQDVMERVELRENDPNTWRPKQDRKLHPKYF